MIKNKSFLFTSDGSNFFSIFRKYFDCTNFFFGSLSFYFNNVHLVIFIPHIIWFSILCTNFWYSRNRFINFDRIFGSHETLFQFLFFLERFITHVIDSAFYYWFNFFFTFRYYFIWCCRKISSHDFLSEEATLHIFIIWIMVKFFFNIIRFLEVFYYFRREVSTSTFAEIIFIFIGNLFEIINFFIQLWMFKVIYYWSTSIQFFFDFLVWIFKMLRVFKIVFIFFQFLHHFYFVLTSFIFGILQLLVQGLNYFFLCLNFSQQSWVFELESYVLLFLFDFNQLRLLLWFFDPNK